MSEQRIVWQPEFVTDDYEFRIYLDPEFAREMIEARISPEKQKRLNEIANEELKRLRYSWIDPYEFHGHSAFVQQVYIGRNGKWLSASRATVEGVIAGKAEPVIYHSHNVDGSADALTLIRLFNKWIWYSDVITERVGKRQQ